MTATVTLVETIGVAPGSSSDATNIHLLSVDGFSNNDYAAYPLQTPGGTPTHSYERWVRFRFDPPFSTVYDFKFWAPGLTIPPGWTLRWGVSQTYQQPVSTPSAIAVNELPILEPTLPNVGGETPLSGEQPRFTDWIVIQASVNGDAMVGPMLGWTGTEPTYVPYRLDWTET